MSDGNESTTTEVWEVVVAKSYDRGNPAKGAEETPVARGAEDEARRVYADTVAEAADEDYAYVKLRHNSDDVESWPQATGWTV